LKLKYLEEENKNKQLTKDLNDAQNQIQNLKVSKHITDCKYNKLIYFSFNFKNEKVKLESGKENLENDQFSNLQKSNEFSDIKSIQKPNDIINVTKVCCFLVVTIKHYFIII